MSNLLMPSRRTRTKCQGQPEGENRKGSTNGYNLGDSKEKEKPNQSIDRYTRLHDDSYDDGYDTYNNYNQGNSATSYSPYNSGRCSTRYQPSYNRPDENKRRKIHRERHREFDYDGEEPSNENIHQTGEDTDYSSRTVRARPEPLVENKGSQTESFEHVNIDIQCDLSALPAKVDKFTQCCNIDYRPTKLFDYLSMEEKKLKKSNTRQKRTQSPVASKSAALKAEISSPKTTPDYEAPPKSPDPLERRLLALREQLDDGGVDF